MRRELEDLGLTEGWIYESILCTYGTNGVPNAAPMGISLGEGGRLVFEPYVNTLTYRNIEERRAGTVNITSDPVIFYRAVHRSESIFGAIALDWFEPSKSVDAPRLKNADIQIDCAVENVERMGERAAVTVNAQAIIRRNRHPIPPYCRARSAVFEATLHSTRIRPLLGDGRVAEAEELIGIIDHFGRVVGKVAPNSDLAEIMKDIQQKVHRWRTEFEGHS